MLTRQAISSQGTRLLLVAGFAASMAPSLASAPNAGANGQVDVPQGRSPDGAPLAPFGETTLDPASSLSGTAGRGLREAPAVTAPIATKVDRDQLYVTPHSDGTWVRGRNYKARLNSEGFRYTPFLGSKAARTWPVDFRLRSVITGGETLELAPSAEVIHYGDRFELDRGPVTVRYDVSVDSVAQSFAIDAPAFNGDLTLELELQTDLTAESDEDEWVFATSRGGVRYGRAIALDGTKVLGDVAVQCDGESLRLTVPGALLQGLEGQLIIDPIITTFTVDDFTTEETNVEVAYAILRDQFTYVWEDWFAQTDVDIFQRGFSSTGTLQSSGYVDSGAENWRLPKIASLASADSWLVVAERQEVNSGRKSIVGRTLNGSQLAVGIELLIGESTTQWENYKPDVGGSWSTDQSSRYLVVWERYFPGPDESFVRFRWVDAGNNMGSVTSPGGQFGFRHEDVKISPSTGDPTTTNRWNIVARRVRYLSEVGRATMGIQVNANGSIPFGMSLSELDDYRLNGSVHDVSDTIDVPGQGPLYFALVSRFYDPIRIGIDTFICRNNELVHKQHTHGWHGVDRRSRYHAPRLAVTRNRVIITSNLSNPALQARFMLSVWDVTADDRLARASAIEPLTIATPDHFDYQPVAIASRHSGGFTSSQYSSLAWTDRGPTSEDVFAAIFSSAPYPTSVGRPRWCGAGLEYSGQAPALLIEGDSSLTGMKLVSITDLPPGATVRLFISRDGSPVPGYREISCQRGMCVSHLSGNMHGTASPTTGSVTFALDPTNLPWAGTHVAATSGERWVIQATFTDASTTTHPCNEVATNGSVIYFE